MFVTAARIRSMIADAMTEQDVSLILRSHKIKHYYTTSTGVLTIRIPCKTGPIDIVKTCSRYNPLRIQQAHTPTYRNDY